MKYLYPFNIICENTLSINEIDGKFNISLYLDNKITSDLVKFDIDDILGLFEMNDISNYSLSEFQYFIRVVNSDGEIIQSVNSDSFSKEMFISHQFDIMVNVYEERYSGPSYVGSFFHRDVNIDKFNNILSETQNLNDKVVKMCDRYQKVENVKIDLKVNANSTNNNNVSKFVVRYNFNLIELDSINDELKSIYDNWKEDQSKDILYKFNKKIEKIKDLFKKRGLEVNLTFMGHDDNIDIGAFVDEDIYGFAKYSIKDDRLSIDNNEFHNLINYLEES